MTSDTKISEKAQDKEEQLGNNDNQREENGNSLTAAQKARSEHNRQKARMLREARLVHPIKCNKNESIEKPAAVDTGGGFFLEEEPLEMPKVVARPAPFVHRSEQPHCLECKRQFPQSYLMDTFDYSVCDACRDDESAHALITRTEAKSEFLLKDCDLDSRPPPLRCLRRRNPHRAHAHDMRLYLRAQVLERALLVWGSPEQLERERELRRERGARAAAGAQRRRLRELRLAARSSLLARAAPAHQHAYGPERHDPASDTYERRCHCGHVQRYEKM